LLSGRLRFAQTRHLRRACPHSLLHLLEHERTARLDQHPRSGHDFQTPADDGLTHLMVEAGTHGAFIVRHAAEVPGSAKDHLKALQVPRALALVEPFLPLLSCKSPDVRSDLVRDWSLGPDSERFG